MAQLNSILSGSLVFKDGTTYLSEVTPGPSAVTVTGSLHVKGSRITLNGSDLAYRITVLEAGQGADQIEFGTIALWTASMNEWSASVKDHLYEINNFSGSILEYTASNDVNILKLFNSASNHESRILLLEGTGSNHESRLDLLESKNLVSSSAQVKTLLPGGSVSSSLQIIELGFITGSNFFDLDDIPQGLVSSSTQVVEYLVDESVDLGLGSITASDAVLDGNSVLEFIQQKNVFSHTGSHASANTDIEITGSLTLNFDGVTKYFKIDVNGEEKVSVNEEGILTLGVFSTTPTAVEGGMYYGSDNNLYLGV